MAERTIYLTNTDIEDALRSYLPRFDAESVKLGVERVDVRTAAGRVTAEPIIAAVSAPNHHAAAMDGIMVIAGRTYTAGEATPVTLTRGTDFDYVNTGHLVKEPYDSVIMIEDVVVLSDGRARITEPAAPWQHIRPIGEDIVAGEMVLPANHRIRPVDIGAVLMSGVGQIDVYERVRVGIMPTGNEIVDCYDGLPEGKSFDTNSWVFAATVEEWGGIPDRVGPVPDDPERLREALGELLRRNHIVAINAGSSAGSEDYTASLIAERGEVVRHGLAIRPGKPTILGLIGRKPVIGVPGFPGSAFLAFEEIVGPVFRKLARAGISERIKKEAIVSRRIVSSLQHREYVRVKLGQVGEKMIAIPLQRGAGMTLPLVQSDGLLIIPQNSEGVMAGETVAVEMTRDIREIGRTIVSIGSHDLIMDYIADRLVKEGLRRSGIYGDGKNGGRPEGGEEPIWQLSSAHVGSMGGLMALARGEAHLAPIHLLDEATGGYNRSAIEKYLPGRSIRLIKGVRREQGLIIAPGNPRGIETVADLGKPDIRFVNRQKGAGTRILTDYLLAQKGVCTSAIVGYDREMTTHMAVAASVRSGTADVGVGVRSAARVMGLDFIPIGFEDYDFAVPEEYADTPPLKAFRAVLDSPEFLAILEELGGYERIQEGA